MRAQRCASQVTLGTSPSQGPACCRHVATEPSPGPHGVFVSAASTSTRTGWERPRGAAPEEELGAGVGAPVGGPWGQQASLGELSPTRPQAQRDDCLVRR